MASDPAPLEPTGQDAFTYTPFPNDHCIRILTLEPGSGHDELAGRLTTEDLTTAPPYDAISYVWGPGGRSASPLLCNGTALPLTQSIHDALSRVRLADGARRLWADQVCINQDDVAERGRQVRLMHAIYGGARRVLVWLGRDDEGIASAAVDMVRYLRGIFDDVGARAVFLREHSEELATQRPERWWPLSSLSKLPWFNRIWIVQEIGTAAPATLYWGNAELDWEELSAVARELNEDFHHLRARFSIYTPNIRYLYRRFVEPPLTETQHGDGEDPDEHLSRERFIYELHRARHLCAKDPRDHVFAFLGHFSRRAAGQPLAELQPDYGASVEDVYFDVAARALKGADTLTLLSALHAPSRGNSIWSLRQGRALPSWVPDWCAPPVHLIGSPRTPHHAAGETRPRLSVDEAARTLHIDGVAVDVVASRSKMMYGKSFAFRHAGDGRGWRPPMIEVLWRETCSRDAFDLSSLHADGGDSAFFALVQTLTNGCRGMSWARPYDEVPPTEWLAHGAAYLLRVLCDGEDTRSHEDALAAVSPELQQAARGGDAFHWSRQATLVSRYRRFGVTAKGRYMLGPGAMQEGDVVAALYGGRTPFLLRPAPEGGGWIMVGECYVHGMMEGEALQDSTGVEQTFSIR